jgi:chitin synthase
LNGSFFASLHALLNFRQIYSSPHPGWQKFVFSLEFIYNAINLLFSWISLANFYLAFHFLFDVKDSVNGPFGVWGPTVFELVRGLYVFALIAMFISSLGNRPQGSKGMYYTISILFAAIMVLMLYLGVVAINLQIQRLTATQGARNTIQFAFTDGPFRDLVVSVLATYGLYLSASIMHLDPWHVITSLAAYLLLLPTFNNMFMIYACNLLFNQVCNLHDVSWGTKGSTTVEEAGPKKAFTEGESGDFIVEISTEDEDVDEVWKNCAKQLKAYRNFKPVQKDSRDQETIKADGTKEFRTSVVLSWLATNLLIIVAFTNEFTLSKLFPKETRKSGDVNPYVTFLFWTVAILSAIRFIGSSIFIIQWCGEKVTSKRIRSPISRA